jgi:predicted transcriptional regulator
MPEKLDERLNVPVSRNMRERVERLADKQDRQIAAVVRAALAAYLRKEESR